MFGAALFQTSDITARRQAAALKLPPLDLHEKLFRSCSVRDLKRLLKTCKYIYFPALYFPVFTLPRASRSCAVVDVTDVTDQMHYSSEVWTHPLIQNGWNIVSKLLTGAVRSFLVAGLR